MSLIEGFIRVIGASIRNHHMNTLMALGARLSDRYLYYYWNEKYYDVHRNGELSLLRTLAGHWKNSPSITVFDVGANIGSYTKLVRETMPNSVVHCFEIVPRTREVLKINLSGLTNVITADCGLSNTEAYLKIACHASDPAQNRMSSPLSGPVDEVVPCRVQAGDTYLMKRNMTRIDLLKIDTEGHEIAILEGFSKALHGSRISVIQFEYGTTWIAPRCFLHEAYTLLKPLGFSIGRLYPDGVFFKPYNRLEDDHFRMGNYVAVHEAYVPILTSLNLNPSFRTSKLRR